MSKYQAGDVVVDPRDGVEITITGTDRLLGVDLYRFLDEGGAGTLTAEFVDTHFTCKKESRS